MSPQRKDQPSRPSPEQIREMQDAADALAREVLGHIYQSMLKTPEFALQNGMKCRVDPYYAPEVNSDGELKCGIDVLTEDGGHLEFTVGHTGWGKSFTKAAEARRSEGKGPGRQP
jgi:hypothetical protein